MYSQKDQNYESGNQRRYQGHVKWSDVWTKEDEAGRYSPIEYFREQEVRKTILRSVWDKNITVSGDWTSRTDPHSREFLPEHPQEYQRVYDSCHELRYPPGFGLL